MQIVPTARVKLTSSGVSLLINAEDFDPRLHELSGEQGPDFDESKLGQRKPDTVDPALRDLAANLMFDVIDANLVRRNGSGFHSLSSSEKMERVREFRSEFDQSVRNNAAARRELAGQTDESPKALDVEEPRPGVEPKSSSDQTGGQGQSSQTQGTSGVNEGDQQEQTGAQGDDTQNQDSGEPDEEPAETPPSGEYGVEEGARGKFYVTRGTTRVSRGYLTREDADQAKSRMENA